jgi:hypothetical protein
VIDHLSVRIALALPLISRATMLAAMQLVIYLMRRLGRIELDLLERPPFLRAPADTRKLNATLLLSATAYLARDTEEARQELELDLRAEIERRYARGGLTSVRYDLQLL